MDENRKIDISSLDELVEHLSVKHIKLAIVLDYQTDLKVSGFGWAIIDLNTDLSQALLNISVAKRPRNVAMLLSNMITDLSVRWVCLAGLEVLFEPSLQVHVVELLKQLAHDHMIVALWPGEYIEGAAKLSYSELGHFEYQDYTLTLKDDFEVIHFQNIIKDTA
jgi:hypothetical protein